MLLYRYEPSGVETVSGEWSGTTVAVTNYLLRQVLVKAETSSTTFDVKIYDSSDRIIQEFSNVTGEINDLTPLPIEGAVTITITSASVDEDFEVMLCFTDC